MIPFSNDYLKMDWAKKHEIQGKTGTQLSLYIQPGASKTAIRGLFQDRLKLSVQSPPVDGAANEAVIVFLAKTLGLSKSKVHLIRGETSRQKDIWVEAPLSAVTSAIAPALEKATSQK